MTKRKLECYLRILLKYGAMTDVQCEILLEKWPDMSRTERMFLLDEMSRLATVFSLGHNRPLPPQYHLPHRGVNLSWPPPS
jgi:hypothetical protein